MPVLTHRSQSCGVPGRSMTDNLITLRLVEEYCETHGTPYFMLGADLQKAFDRVGHSWMKAVLQKMGIGPIFCGFVNTMYRDITFQVQINGALIEPAKITRGVRQGCALSMLLFVLCLEPFLETIRKEPRISGVPVPSPDGSIQDLKALGYADDSVILGRDKSTWDIFWEIARKYEEASEAKFHPRKIEVCLFGDWSGRDQSFLPPQFVKPEVKVLGAMFGKRPLSGNWGPKLKCISEQLDKTGARHLRDKVKYINVYVLPQISHLFQCYPPEDAQVKKLWQMFQMFVIGGYSVSRATLSRDFQHGGLRVPDPRIRALASFAQVIRRYVLADTLPDETEKPIWFGLLAYYIGFTLRAVAPTGARPRFTHAFLRTPSNVASWPLLLFQQITALDPTVDWKKMSTKRAYWMLINRRPQPVTVMVQYPRLDWKGIWSAIFNRELTWLDRKTPWRTIHEKLPVSASLGNRVRCYFCKICDETQEHLFFACKCLRPIIEKLNLLLKVISRDMGLSYDLVKHLGALVPNLSVVQARVLLHVCAALQNAVWSTRCSLMGNPSAPFSALSVLKAIHFRLGAQIRLDFTLLNEGSVSSGSGGHCQVTQFHCTGVKMAYPSEYLAFRWYNVWRPAFGQRPLSGSGRPPCLNGL